MISEQFCGRFSAMLTLIVFAVSFHCGAGQTVITTTSLGRVMGVKTPLPYSNFTDLVVTRYTGIPYAEPPTGQLRFAKPVAKNPWDGVLNATVFGPSCPQTSSMTGVLDLLRPNEDVSEDCLMLNVYVPHDTVNASGLLPVMVYIHGGGLADGQGAIYDGSHLAVRGRVIVVNFNYRLGLFGFLTTGDDSAPGNYGLWDQRLAIQWVKDNIENFGGDPNQITIFGESAGSWSVIYQMVSPLNDRNLFQRVIAQSGAPFGGLIIPGELAKSQVRDLAISLGCNLPYGSTTRHLISCLRGFSMETLLSQASIVPTAVTIDGEFLPGNLDSLLSNPRIGQYDLLLGVNSQDATVFPAPSSLTAQELRDSLQLLVYYICQCDNPQDITDALFTFYFGADKLDDTQDNVLKYYDVAGDLYFNVRSATIATRHAMSEESTNTYFYYFTYDGGKEFFIPPHLLHLISGAPHVLDVFYIFGQINYFLPDNTDAATLSNTMIEYWTQFVRNGDPNSADLTNWPRFDPENETYIILETNITMGQHFKADEVVLWYDYLPKIAERSDLTTCSYEVPVRGETLQKPNTTTVEISSGDGQVLGSVIGALRKADEAMGGEEIAEFLGIPYAKPPLGDLRFRPPKDTGPWGDEPLAIPNQLPPACPQDVTLDPWMVRLGFNRTNEDCLTLNIYAPTTGSATALPVVVFVHPGYRSYGTSSIFDAVLLASRIKAVVVVTNYRLGALGFLTTEDEVAPGNYGIHDILAALKWVQKYIGSFGGDADRVTIVGHGGGSAITHFLVVSEKARGLFQRAVCMSASSISSVLDNEVQPRASEKTKELASAVGCPTNDSELMFNCLRRKPVADFIRNTKSFPFGVAFPVVVDNDILTDKPIELLKAGKINDVDLLIGITQDEAAALAFAFFGSNITRCPSAADIEQALLNVSTLSFHNPGLASLALATEYLGKGGLGDDCKTRGSFRQLLNDYLSTWSTLEAARLHANAGHSVHLYIFAQEPPTHYNSFLPPQAGPSYGDDLQFLFGDPYSPLLDELQLSYRLEDKQFSLELTTFFKNFIYDGAPGTSLSGVEWPAFDSGKLNYMSLTDCPKACSGHDNNWENTRRFWADLLPSITAPTPSPSTLPPPRMTPNPPDPQPCIVGEAIGLRLTPAEASTLIQVLMGLIIGALAISVFFFGGCMAYRARANRAEKTGNWQDAGKNLPIYHNTVENEEENTKL